VPRVIEPHIKTVQRRKGFYRSLLYIRMADCADRVCGIIEPLSVTTCARLMTGPGGPRLIILATMAEQAGQRSMCIGMREF
jgi:hypothetical protein